MKNDQSSRHSRTFLWLAFVLLLLSAGRPLTAQSNLPTSPAGPWTISSSGNYVDYLIPISVTYSKIQFVSRGADGGKRLYSPFCNAKGGGGATATAAFGIGCGTNDLRPGGTIRFVVGESGTSNSGSGVEGGGGGGGTAILYKAPNSSTWTILQVAGGGGGAFLNGTCDDNDGRSGATTTSGSDGKGTGGGNGGSGGDGGNLGHNGLFQGCGGGGMTGNGGNAIDCGPFTPNGGGKKGGTTGDDGGQDGDCVFGQDGGFGFGGGGLSSGGGGGGGGYSGGGGGGYQGGGGGGGSYVNAIATSSSISGGSVTSSPDDGYCTFQWLSNTGSAIYTLPTVTCSNITVQVPDCPNGSLTVAAEDLATASGGCGTLSYGGDLLVTCEDVNHSALATVIVTDGAGNTASCTSTVTVKAEPVAICKDITVNLSSSGSVTVTASQVDNGSNDPDGGSVSLAFYEFFSTPTSVTYSCANLGANSELLVVTDNEGETDYCVATITVKDVTAPTITCPANQTVTASASCAGTVGSYSLVSKTDNCTASGSLTVTQSPVSTTTLSGHNDSKTVTFTATDASGNSKTCSFTVTLKDVTPPTITCPANQTVAADGNCSGTVGSYTLVAKTDNCTSSALLAELQSQTGTTLSGHNSTQTVTFTAGDQAGNQATCSFTVTLKDVQAPTITCPANQTVAADASCSGTVGSYSLLSKTDNCTASASITATQSPVSTTTLSGHNDVKTVTFTATDAAGNTKTCSFSVTLKDATAPTISCPANQTVSADASCSGTVGAYSLLSKTDNCTASASITVTQSPASTTTLSGHNDAKTVTFTATDAAGNSKTCSFTVTLKDVQAPAISCPANQTVSADASCSGTVGAYSLLTKTDNCTASASITATQSPASATVLSGHNTAQTVTFTATDAAGNSKTCSFTVTLKDVTAPTITCPANQTVSADASCSGTIGAYSLLSKTDNCTASASITATQSPVSTTTLSGSNDAKTVTFTATDAAGNSKTCSFTVTLKDVQAPTIVCPADQTVAADADCSHELGEWGPVSLTDNCTATNNLYYLQIGESDEVLTGQDASKTVVLYGYDEAENEASCSFTVTLKDVTPPTVSCHDMVFGLGADNLVNIGLSDVSYGATDNCGTATLVSISPNSFSCDNIGANDVTVTFSDGHGNNGSCIASVGILDITPPTVVCQDFTAYVTADGHAFVQPADIYQSGADECGMVNLVSAIPTNFSCDELGAHAVTLTVNDGHGNEATCTATVTAVDLTNPTVVCKDAAVNLDASGAASISTGDVFESGTDNCGSLNQLSVSPATFSCSNLGANTVTLTVSDGHGNNGTCTATVTVSDNTPPTIICKNATLYLQLLPSIGSIAFLSTSDVYQSGTDNCGTVIPLSVQPVLFNCSLIGSNTVTLTASDAQGNTTTCTATVTVVDNTPPTVACKNVTVNLSAAGTGSITTGDVYLTGFDDCGSVSQVSVAPNAFTCANVGTNTVVLSVSDGHGNIGTCNATVTVVDNTAPSVTCKTATVNLDASGVGSITAASVYQSGSDNCGTVNLTTVVPNSFTCNNIGANVVALSVNDGHGNIAFCTTTVTVADLSAPAIVCKNATVNLNGSGTGDLLASAITQSVADNCGGYSTSAFPTAFTCSNIGVNVVTLTAVDSHNNTSTCTATVTVADVTAPTVVCKNATVNLSAAGAAGILTADVFQTASDNCSTVNQVSVTPNAFTCINIGANTVQLTVNDGHGNTATCQATVTVADNLAPTAVCKNATVNLDASGAGSITTTNVFQSGADNCGTVNQLSVSPNTFNCNNLGANTVQLTVNDGHGNTATCQATVTVVDNLAPTVVCKNATVYLNALGAASIGMAAVFQSGADNCGTVNQVSVSPNAFICGNIGANTVLLSVNDGHGNTGSCSATVTVADTTRPILSCSNFSVNLNAAGTVSITTADVPHTVADNCSVGTQTVTPSVFNCNNLNANLVQVAVSDGNGNTNTCTVTVTVVDNLAPTVVCKNATVNLDAAGVASIGTAAVFQSGSDNCGAINQVSVLPNTFTCSNLGANTVQLTVNDGHGNTATCTATVTVADNSAPGVVCKNATVNLNAAGTAGIVTGDVFQSAADNCGTVNPVSVAPATFNCSNLGTNPVTLTVNDGHGNSATCTATVTIVDNIAPTVVCKNATVYLSIAGAVTVLPGDVFQSGADNCGTVNQVSVGPNTFSCSGIGPHFVTLSVNDGHGNSAACTATVTVADNLPPTVVCKNATVNLSAAGTANIGTADVFQSGADNCGLVDPVSVSPNAFTCSNLGANTVSLTVNDSHGNTATCTATVTVVDNIAPTVICKNATVNLNAAGTASLVTTYVFQSGADNCGLVNQVSLSPNTFTCSNLGTNTVVLTVNDGHGNTATCQATVTVVDNIAPTVVCKNATVNLNTAGMTSLVTADVFQSGADNCGTVNQVSVAPNTFNCSNLGANTVTLNANDGHGNSAACTATVTVVDNLAPTVICKPVTVNLSAAGTGGIGTADVYQSGSDNCGTVNQVSVSPNTFTCSNLGANTVTLTVNDGHGLTATCQATVTVADNIAPTVVCKTVNVALSAAGHATISPADVFQSGADNCGTINQVSVTPSTFSCGNLGLNTVTLLINDGHGNTASCTTQAKVFDNLAPTLLCKNVTVSLDAAGLATVTTAQVNNGSSDNCTLSSLSLSQTAFSCANVGANAVILSGVDQSSNKGACTATVTVVDAIAPVAICKNATVQLGATGSVTVPGTAINNGSSDNCSFSLSVTPATFTCANIGANTVTLKATDAAGLSTTCQAVVTVQDKTGPTALCKNISIFLDNAGQATLTAAQVNNGSSDNCGIASMTINNSQFDCGQIGGSALPVTLTVKDGYNNQASCIAYVTVKDAIAPTAICQNTTVQLNAQGKATVYGATLAANSYDNCSVWSYSPTAKIYTCSNLGMNNLTVTVKDYSGNAATCVSVVTVQPPPGGCNTSQGLNVAGGTTYSGPPAAGDLDLRMYPNPADDQVTLEFALPADQPCVLRVFDLAGRLVMQQSIPGSVGENTLSLQLNGLVPGLYLVDLQSLDLQAQKRLIVQE